MLCRGEDGMTAACVRGRLGCGRGNGCLGLRGRSRARVQGLWEAGVPHKGACLAHLLLPSPWEDTTKEPVRWPRKHKSQTVFPMRSGAWLFHGI